MGVEVGGNREGGDCQNFKMGGVGNTSGYLKHKGLGTLYQLCSDNYAMMSITLTV